MCAAIYLQLSLANVFTLFSARTAGFFCTGAPPAAVMLFALSLAMIFAALMSAYWPAHLNEHVVLILDASAFRSRAQYTEVHTRVGVRMVGCPPYLIGFTFVYVLVWWAIQDTAKVLLQQLLARADAGTVPGAGLAAPPPGAGRSGKAGTDRPGAPVVLMAEP